MTWWPAILGWPAILLAMSLAVTGVLRERPILQTVGSVLLLPIALYLVGSPRIGWVGIVPPGLLLGSALATWKGQSKLAWFFLIPVFVAVAWLAVIVASE